MLGIVQGTLKGHDQLMNLVLDDVQEMLRGISVPASISSPSSTLLPVCITPADWNWLQTTKATHPPAPLA